MLWRLFSPPLCAPVASRERRHGLALAEHGRRPRVVLTKVGLLERFLDFEAGDGERTNHLEGEKSDDVDSIISSLEVERGGKIEKLFEALRFTVCERCLTTIGVVLVLFTRHLTGRIVRFL